MSEINELDELAREIRRNIADNKKFLDRIMDEDFEAEEIETDEEPVNCEE